MKIHYRNTHGGTNLPWQNAFKKLGDLSLGTIHRGDFPDEIDHLHLGGSCKGAYSLSGIPITVGEVKSVQERTGCSISVFFGDSYLERFRFHNDLLDADIPKLKIYSASLYGTGMWRDEVNWVLHPTDENIFKWVDHKDKGAVLFCGSNNNYRRDIIKEITEAGIKVDIVGRGGNCPSMYGKDLVEFSKNYLISFGLSYHVKTPKNRYSSTRLPNFLAMGMIYIETDFNLEDVFEKDEIIQWNSIPSLINKIKFWREHPEEGLKIIKRGRKKVLDNWTFNKLAERFLREG